MIIMNNKSALMLIISGWGLAAPGHANAFSLANTPNIRFLQEKLTMYELTVPSRFRLSNLQVLSTSHGEIDFESRLLNCIGNNSVKLNPVWLSMIEYVKRNNSKLNILMHADFFGSINYKVAEYIIEVLRKGSLGPEQLNFYFMIEGAKDKELLIKFIYDLTEKIRRYKLGEIAGIVCHQTDAFNSNLELTKSVLDGTKVKIVDSVTKILEDIKKGRAEGGYLVSRKGKLYKTLNAYDGLIDLNLEDDKFALSLRNLIIQNYAADDGEKLGYYNLCEISGIENSALVKKFIPSVSLPHFISSQKYGQSVVVAKSEAERVLKALNIISELVDGQELINVYETNPLKEQKIIMESIIDIIRKNQSKLIIGYISTLYKTALTGKLDDLVIMLESLDKLVGKLINFAVNSGYVIGITSDVGLVESIYNNKGEVNSGSLNPVPAFFIESATAMKLNGKGDLKDFSPTLLACCGYPKPFAMQGFNLKNI